jgi:hypothetical protein
MRNERDMKGEKVGSWRNFRGCQSVLVGEGGFDEVVG